jgi:hypothetical protein
MPTEPIEPMTPEDWVALEAAHKAATPGTWALRAEPPIFDTLVLYTRLLCGDWVPVPPTVQNREAIAHLHNTFPAILEYHQQVQDALNYAYQLAGMVGAGTEALDNLSAVAHGDPPPHPWPVAESKELQEAEKVAAAAVEVIDSLDNENEGCEGQLSIECPEVWAKVKLLRVSLEVK